MTIGPAVKKLKSDIEGLIATARQEGAEAEQNACAILALENSVHCIKNKLSGAIASENIADAILKRGQS